MFAVVAEQDGSVVFVDDQGKYNFPTFESEADLLKNFPGSSVASSITVPDFGLGATCVKLYRCDVMKGETISAISFLEKWRNGSVAGAPVFVHVLQHLKEKSWDIQDAMYLPYASNTVICPLLSNTLPPFKHTNLVIFKGLESAVMIDPGTTDIKALEGIMKKEFGNVSTVYVLITHRHKDHWEAMGFVEKHLPKKIVLCGSKECLSVVPSAFKSERKLFPMTERSMLDLGGNVVLDIIPTPGHTDGDLSVFYEKASVIVVGDLCVGYGSSVLDGQCGDLSNYLESCKMVGDLNPRVVVPAHGPLNYQAKQMMQQYIDHRMKREKAIQACVDKGLTTPQQIVEVVYKETPKELWPSAMSNISLHLKKLDKERCIKNNL